MDWHPLGHVLATGSQDFTTRFWCRNRPADEDPGNGQAAGYGGGGGLGGGTYNRLLASQEAQEKARLKKEQDRLTAEARMSAPRCTSSLHFARAFDGSAVQGLTGLSRLLSFPLVLAGSRGTAWTRRRFPKRTQLWLPTTLPRPSFPTVCVPPATIEQLQLAPRSRRSTLCPSTFLRKRGAGLLRRRCCGWERSWWLGTEAVRGAGGTDPPADAELEFGRRDAATASAAPAAPARRSSAVWRQAAPSRWSRSAAVDAVQQRRGVQRGVQQRRRTSSSTWVQQRSAAPSTTRLRWTTATAGVQRSARGSRRLGRAAAVDGRRPVVVVQHTTNL